MYKKFYDYFIRMTYLRDCCFCNIFLYIYLISNCKIYFIEVVTKASLYFFVFAGRYDEKLWWPMIGEVYPFDAVSLHRVECVAFTRRPCPAVIAVKTDQSADRSHDLSFSALSAIHLHPAFASPFLCTSLLLFCLWFPTTKLPITD